jgi:hypothetical protein
MLLFAAVLFQGCKSDFQVNAQWKEIRVIYGLLSSTDTVHYIRIERAYQNGNGQTAYNVGKMADSLYDDTLNVTLQDMSDPTVAVRTLRRVPSLKDTGTFADTGYVYATAPWQLNPDHQYHLSVINPKTNVRSTATTSLVAPITIVSPSPLTNAINFAPKVPVRLSFNPGANAKFYNLTLVIHYREFAGSDTTTAKAEKKQLTWPIFSYNIPSNGTEMYTYVQGSDFFTFLQQHIPAVNNVRRKMDNIEMQISGGGEAIYNYILVNQPSIGLVQKKPDYTNIQENGYGVFSSRSYWNRFLIVGATTRRYIETDASMQSLNFIE